MPCFFNSPQFFNLAISKSNLLLAVTCCTDAICASAACSHWSLSFLFNGMDKVADSPALNDWFALMSVLIGFIHVGVMEPFPSTISGTPLGPSISISICISSPSSNHLLPSALVLVSYQSSHG